MDGNSVIGLIVLFSICSGDNLERTPVDLTHTLSGSDFASMGATFGSNNSLITEMGTHFMAPCSYSKDKWCTQNIPLDHLVAPAVVIDLRGQVWSNSSAVVTEDFFWEWEKLHGPVPDKSVVLLMTGWSQLWANVTAYRGTDSEDHDDFKFPSIDESAANWLVGNRTIFGVGIDSMSLERGGNEVHKVLADRNVYVVENLAGLEMLDETGSNLFVMPLKMEGAGIVPCRVLSMVVGSPRVHPAPTTTTTFKPPTITTTPPSTDTTTETHTNNSDASHKEPVNPTPAKAAGETGAGSIILPTCLLTLISLLLHGNFST